MARRGHHGQANPMFAKKLRGSKRAMHVKGGMRKVARGKRGRY